MKIGRLLLLSVLIGFFTVATRAQTDPDVHIADPASCPSGAICVTIDYSGPAMEFTVLDPLQFTVPAPGLPDYLSYLCTSYNPLYGPPPPVVPPTTNLGFAIPLADGNFGGCDFYGYFTPGDYTFSIQGGSAVFDLPEGWTGPDGSSTVDLPEPNTAVLFLTGILLLILAGAARARFGANPATN